ncbi:MAG: AMP-binding protein [Actinomycetia bacterium]|nr:AMP-binding protein [Actinomycetes bacterium]
MAPAPRRHPVPSEVRDRWRTLGVWTDETLIDRLLAAPESFAGDVVVDGGTRRSCQDLVDMSAAVAAALSERGVRQGDVVCWQLPNWWEAIVFCWGVLRLGAIASPITPSLRAHEVGFVLEQCRARLIAVPETFRGTNYAEMVASTAYAGEVVTVRGGGEFVREFLAPAPAPPAPVISADDPAVILWTSGTTSVPKGVVHTHQSLRVEADSIAEAHCMTAGDVLLLPMPVTHVAGLTYGVLLPLTAGIRAVLMDVWEPGAGLHLLEREHVNVMISTPVFMRSMIDHEHWSDCDTSALRLFSLGGAGVAPSMVREGAQAFGGPRGCWCKRTYGSTEYPTLSTGYPGDGLERDATTDGRIIGPADVRVVDPATGDDTEAGAPGELLVRGPEMFSGYLDAALDHDAFTAGGWFRTGDLATFDGTYLTIVDRLKDVIIRGGENISAAEVEAMLASHADVVEAACVATPDPLMGERVCAYVILRPGSDVTLETLRHHLVGLGLARFKLPERLEIRTGLPRTASGKVQKAPLRAEQREM